MQELDTAQSKTIFELLDEFSKAAFIEDATLNSTVFFSRNQLPNETCREFSNNLWALARSAFGNTLENAQLKQRVKERFLTGLRAPIGARVRTQLPSTFEEAVRLAVAQEAELGYSNVNIVKPMSYKEIRTPRFQGRLPTPRNMSTVKNYVKPATVCATEANPNQARICYRCQKVGHIAKFCPTKQKTDQSKNGPRSGPDGKT